MNQGQERYSWIEWQNTFPEQWCGLIDVVRREDRRVPFQSATLLCHGNDRREVGEQFEEMDGTDRMMIYTNLNHVYAAVWGGTVVVRSMKKCYNASANVKCSFREAYYDGSSRAIDTDLF